VEKMPKRLGLMPEGLCFHRPSSLKKCKPRKDIVVSFNVKPPTSNPEMVSCNLVVLVFRVRKHFNIWKHKPLKIDDMQKMVRAIACMHEALNVRDMDSDRNRFTSKSPRATHA
jgi:hypothetical protein